MSSTAKVWNGRSRVQSQALWPQSPSSELIGDRQGPYLSCSIPSAQSLLQSGCSMKVAVDKIKRMPEPYPSSPSSGTAGRSCGWCRLLPWPGCGASWRSYLHPEGARWPSRSLSGGLQKRQHGHHPQDKETPTACTAPRGDAAIQLTKALPSTDVCGTPEVGRAGEEPGDAPR